MDKRKRFKLTLEIFRGIFKIFPIVKGQDFDALPNDEAVVSFLRDIGHTGEINSLNDVDIEMHTSRDDYLINTLRFVSTKEETQIYGVILPECLTSSEIKEIQASTEKPTRKSKKIKMPAKKSTEALARGVVIRETPSMPLIKTKEKVDVTRDEDDEEEVKDEFVKTPLNNSDDKFEGDEEMDYTTSQLYNDVDIRLNEPVDIDKGFVQEEGTNVAMTNKTNVLVTSSSHSSDLVANFLKFSDITHTDDKIVSPFDVHFHHEAILDKETSQLQSSYEASATLIEFELKKILIDKMDKSESYIAAPQQRECYEGLKKSYNLDKTIFSTYGKVYSFKRSRKDKVEDPSAGSDRWLKKRKSSKDAELAKGLKAKESQSSSSKDSDMPQDQEENPGNDDEEPKEKVASKQD
uniref:Uncharacterized protein n=1 Tax=Tanacetum cinerariifolium TaxID=118510 RepID=A0A6L2MQS2_TANCI|nr:hypothetical protein [Tanacetum cinerariifolium]